MSVAQWPAMVTGRLRRFVGIRRGGPPASSQLGRDLRALIRLALPSMVATIAGSVMSFVDFAFVSILGSEAQAAVGNASVLVWTFFGLGTGIVSAVATFAAQSLGQHNPREGATYMWQAVYLSVLLGLLSLLLIPAMPWLYRILEHPPEVAVHELSYTRILLLGTIPMVACSAISNYFNGMHRPAVTMVSMIVANLLNVALDYALIFGHFGLPAMGVAGAAWATVISATFRLACLLLALGWPSFGREFQPFAAARLSLARLRGLMRVGGPIGLQWVADIGSWALFANWLVSRFGTQDIAATQIVWKLLEFSWMPAIGIGVGINAVIGKAIGQGDYDLAKRRARLGVILTASYMGAMGTIFALFRHGLVGWFATEQAVLDLGANLMLLAAAFQVFDAMSIGYGSALRGAGDTKWPAIALAACSYSIAILGGWLVSIAWPSGGSYGPWIMCTIYAIVLSLLLRHRWIRGKWKNINIFAASPELAGTN
jgi:MATE family multidrug resistance protein